MKKINRRAFLKVVGVSASALGLAACGGSSASSASTADSTAASSEASSETEAVALKAGFICLHDENSTYDLNFINGAKEACEKLGVECVIKTGIPEGQECYDAACELADAGCNFVFADSFGHEDYVIEAAKEFEDVEFAHATGTQAHTAGLANFHNAFATIFQGRYLAGIAAGMKLNEMLEAGTIDTPKIGYVGAFTYAEVMSGYTSFFLGARSVCPDATMEVTFSGDWYNETAEKEGANKLIDNGCVLISQHADSMGAPTACETAGVPNVSYNGSTESACPNTFIISSRIDWAPYFEYALTAIQNGESFDTDWCGNLETGSVVLTDLGKIAPAEGTAEAIETAKAALISGDLHVFDTSTFTVDGAELTTYMADVDTDAAYEGDHEAIVDGYFNESGEGLRSAPFFNIEIDGITLLDTNYGG